MQKIQGKTEGSFAIVLIIEVVTEDPSIELH